MNAYSKKEKLLEVVFAVLMVLSLICFAGIPALDYNYAEANQTYKVVKK